MLAHTVNTSYALAIFKHTHVQYSSLVVGRKKLRITALKVKKKSWFPWCEWSNGTLFSLRLEDENFPQAERKGCYLLLNFIAKMHENEMRVLL